MTRNYSNTAVVTTETGLTTGAGTSLTLASATGWPTAPFTAVVEPGTANAEVILVGARTTTACSTITRGYDGTTAVTHPSGSVITAEITAIDASEANTHVNATGVVHGLTGSIVGTTDTQTLTNKTMAGGSNTFSAIAEGSLSDRSNLYAYRNAAATIPASASNLLIAYDTTVKDSSGTWTPASGLVFPTTGTYWVMGGTGWPAIATTGLLVAEWRKNAAGAIGSGTRVNITSQLAPNTVFTLQSNFPVTATAGDTLECWVRQSPASTAALQTGQFLTYASLVRISS